MSGHIRRRGERSWELKFDVGRDPITGRRQTRYLSFKGSKKEAQAELRRQLQAIDDGKFVEPTKLTLGEFLIWWLDTEAAFQVSAKTLQEYRRMAVTQIIPAIGAVQLRKLEPRTVQQFYKDKLRSGRLDGKGGLSANTVNHFDRLLHVALKRAVVHRKIPHNPMADVERPKMTKKEIDALNDAEVRKLLNFVKGSPLYPICYVALATGLRRGEMLGLQWRDINFDQGKLNVRRSLEQTQKPRAEREENPSQPGYRLQLKAPKTKAGKRTVSVPESCLEVLREHRRTQAKQRLALGIGKAAPTDHVFSKPDGSFLVPENLGKQVAAAAKNAGLGKRGIHVLRHTHITSLLKAGVHIKVASERAGHTSVATTLDIYGHVLEDMQAEAAQKVDTLLRGALDT